MNIHPKKFCWVFFDFSVLQTFLESINIDTFFSGKFSIQSNKSTKN